MNILDEIFAYKASLYPAARPSLVNSLMAQKGNAIIGEIKRGSPSKGLFAKDLDIPMTVERYTAHDVCGISVLTDQAYFYGSFDDLKYVSQLTDKPILCKDFIVSYQQIAEAYANGASAILLIARMLDEAQLSSLISFAHGLAIEVLMEIHFAEEYEKIKALPFDILGINNRNLDTFHTDVAHSVAVYKKLKLGGVSFPVISESGFMSIDAIERVLSEGFSGVLVGEGMVKEKIEKREQRTHERLQVTKQNIKQNIKQGSSEHGDALHFNDKHKDKMPEKAFMENALNPSIKICGLKDTQMIDVAYKQGATHVGFVLAESKRKVTEEEAKRFITYIRKNNYPMKSVVVLKEVQASYINKLSHTIVPDYFQVHGALIMDEPIDKGIQIIFAMGMKAIKTLIDNGQITSALKANRDTMIPILIDSPVPGSGERFDWTAIPSLQSVIDRPLWIAGGLTPDNVKTLIKTYPIAGVDVSSGVEIAGEKNKEMITAFIKEAKEGFQND